MSIFNKPPAERSQARADQSSGDPGAMSVIANGMRILGDVESNGTIKVEGVIEGAVRGARQVLLGKSGVVHGDIHAGDAVLGGKVVGAVVASERVEIQGTASVEGDIHTKSIVVYEGGSINGAVRMGESASQRAATSPPAPGMRLASDG